MKSASPKAGEVWELKSDLAEVAEEIHVLVTRVHEDTPSARVAKIMYEGNLSGPDDHEIEKGVFAEGWNTFPAALEDLEEKVFHKNYSEIAGDIEAGEEKGGFQDVFGSLFKFREFEIEVGARIAMAAFPKILPPEPEEDEDPWQ